MTTVVTNIFLSFAMEDKALVDRLRHEALKARSLIKFRDYSTRQPADGEWKAHAERLIRVSTATVCLVGEATWRSEPVNWEIRRSAQLGKRVLAVQLHSGPVRIPEALSEIGVRPMPWDVNAIAEALSADDVRVDSVEAALFASGEPLASDREALLTQYRLFVSTSESLVSRRQAVNTFLLAMNTAILSLLGLLLGDGQTGGLEAGAIVGMGLGGLICCFAWHRLMVAVRQLSKAKFEVIHALERRLPARLFTAEWAALGHGQDPKRYLSFSRTEIWTPWIFGALQLCVVLSGLWMLLR